MPADDWKSFAKAHHATMKASNPKASYKAALKEAGPLFKQHKGTAGTGAAKEHHGGGVKMGLIKRNDHFEFSFGDADPFDFGVWTTREMGNS